MKMQSITKILFITLISMMGVNVFAYDIEVKNADGVTIYYNYINDGKELEVAQGDYHGKVVIPKEVTNINTTRTVISIGNRAFYDCNDLTSVTIPNSVISIDNYAFYGCSGLTSVTIPNSVISIGNYAFYRCSGLASVTIPNSVTSIGERVFQECCGLTKVTISKSVTSIGEWSFSGCSGLTSIIIPNGITSIGERAFQSCRSLTSVTIPSSLTFIDSYAFDGCYGLTSVIIADVAAWCNICFNDGYSNPLYFAKHLYLNSEEVKELIIPNGVTSIGAGAFFNCYRLNSVTIPNSVTSIGNGAFQGCSGLTSVTIPNSVTSIGNFAFYGVDIVTVISQIENPFKIDGTTSGIGVFSKTTFNNATLYVPVGTIEKYKATEGWKEFLFIEEGTGPNGSGETPETKKCAKPSIGYQNGKLTFNCETEGATCQYTITDDDIKSGSANEIQLGVTYRINVYATKSGYDNSETATATLCWIDVEPKTDGITNGVANVRAQPLLIHTNGNTMTVSGADDGTPITVYSINGTEAGSAISHNGAAIIPTALQSGSAAIVKVGYKSVKVVVK